ncbi:MAG: DNA mismatch repair protein MutS [Acholeplasmatales bacterium]|jgi:DNA mismatch repair protein MutS|nr:DNA mismatch repair protein MutS [Acholeplasmataceae bacterium]MDY0115208.1 DNA mismatch repair protein MutS [Acholeplasmatales bacterium]
MKYTPMIRQYLDIKKDYADCLVFFRLGDFYELFFEDAKVASKELEIALTARDGGAKERIPMCGVPHHSVNPYLQKLINKGYKVAIAEQVSEPGDGLVERKVVKLITPGMVVDDLLLAEKQNNYLASIGVERLNYSFCYADISTGEIVLWEKLSLDELEDEVTKKAIKELVLSKEVYHLEKYFPDVLISKHNNYLSAHNLADNLTSQSKKTVLHLLSYLSQIEESLINVFNELEIADSNKYLKLDNNSIKALELTEGYSLFKVLDKNETNMGSRLLKQMIENPLSDETLIKTRQDYIEALKEGPLYLVREALNNIYDLKRITARIANFNANPKDFIQLKNSLLQVPKVKEALLSYQKTKLTEFAKKLDSHQQLLELLTSALKDDAPITIKEGGIFKEGYHEKRDQLANLKNKGQQWVLDFEAKEREKTNIKNLRVGFNKVFGYYIEITKANIPLVKEEFGYLRKQTLVGSERYINSELKAREAEILNAKESLLELEYQLFLELREKVSFYQESLQILADKLSFIDVMQSLARVALENNYVKPEIRTNREIHIREGRHPIIEIFNPEPFIANDVSIMPNGILIITGPNMSGKSTYMRMVALIVIMAQIGSFVPATEAKLALFDAIFTRIGAQDDITSGKSTFMVEMVETNYALKNATKNSLMLFDEIGRGTATYDGMALAQGIVEYVHEKVKAVMLFSTHYHELTALEQLKRVKNIHVKAVLEKGKLIFLHQVSEGATDKSYGINVAALAKLPKPLIHRSQLILEGFEENQKQEIALTIFNFDDVKEGAIFDQVNEHVIHQLKEVNINDLTPIEALLMIKKLQEEIK